MCTIYRDQCNRSYLATFCSEGDDIDSESFTVIFFYLSTPEIFLKSQDMFYLIKNKLSVGIALFTRLMVSRSKRNVT